MAGILTERLMNHRPLLLPLALLVPLALAACNKPAEPATDPAASSMAADPAAPPALADTAALLPAYHWRLAEATDAQGQKIEPLFVNADKPVQLDFAEGRVSVSNTCNRMTGGFTQAGDTATAGPFASTLMACPDPALAALDAEVGKRLEGELAVASTAGDVPQLVLTNAAGDRLVFHGAPTADTRFGGPGERVFLEVAAETKPCSHPLIPDKQCLQVREITFDDNGLRSGEPGEWQNFYDQIEGFSHQPGTRNVLRVNRYTVANPPADGSSQAFVLDMVVESELVKP